jgi:outer membrane immunogenic protein
MGDGVMKKLLLAGAALAMNWIVPAVAADLPVKAPVYKAASVAAWEWTGCYIGVAGGGNWGRTSNSDLGVGLVGLPVTNPFNLSGGIIGGTVGCNYQIQKFVIGLEGDISWTNKDGVASEIPPFNTNATFGVREHWIDTLRGRLGYKFGERDQFLLYVTGGVASARVEALTCNVVCFTATNTMTGWTIGGGGEWAIFPAAPVPHGWLSVKVEYLYVDLGNKDFLFDPTVPGLTSKNVSLIDHIARVGLNWHF